MVVGRGLRQAVNPKLIALMGPDDGQAQLLGQVGGGTCVVDVGVGEPNLFQPDTELLAGVLQHGQIATGVDDGGLVRFIAPNDGTVLLEGGDGDGLVLQHMPQILAAIDSSLTQHSSVPCPGAACVGTWWRKPTCWLCSSTNTS